MESPMEMQIEVHQMLDRAIAEKGCKPTEAYKYVDGKRIKNGRIIKFYWVGDHMRVKLIKDPEQKRSSDEN